MVYDRIKFSSFLAVCLTFGHASARGQASSKPDARPQVATYKLVENAPYYLKDPRRRPRPDGALQTGKAVVMVRESQYYSLVRFYRPMQQKDVVAFVKTSALQPVAAAKRDANVTMPDISTEKGVLCRQLIAKRNNPGHP